MNDTIISFNITTSIVIPVRELNNISFDNIDLLKFIVYFGHCFNETDIQNLMRIPILNNMTNITTLDTIISYLKNEILVATNITNITNVNLMNFSIQSNVTQNITSEYKQEYAEENINEDLVSLGYIIFLCILFGVVFSFFMKLVIYFYCNKNRKIYKIKIKNRKCFGMNCYKLKCCKNKNRILPMYKKYSTT